MYIAAAVRCAPPANKPTILERDTCAPFLVREMGLLDVDPGRAGAGRVRVGCRAAGDRGAGARRAGGRRPVFGHGAEVSVGPYMLVGTYHPSQQNTFTGRLTAAMFDTVIARALELASRAAASGTGLS